MTAAQVCPGETTGDSYLPNAGWLRWNPGAGAGAVFNENYAAGYIYAANIGWIHLGDGAPANGRSYANSSADDYGVNVDDTSHADYYLLHGYAWSANCGWINFDVEAVAGFENQPRVARSTGALLGYAWSANLGWIRLDASPQTLQVIIDELIDTGGLTLPLLRDYLLGSGTLTSEQLIAADKNSDSRIDLADIIWWLLP